MQLFSFGSAMLTPAAEEMRAKVRAFLAAEKAAGRFQPHHGSWIKIDRDFSRRAGAAGFIGMTFPKEYGGHGLSSLEKFAVSEEMLVSGAPCGAHWGADRQSGPQILIFGTEYAKRLIIPRIVAGECYFSVGMSEPDTGSDLASVRCRADRTEGGWRINGTKVWTSAAQIATYLIILVRTEPGSQRHGGLSQMIVDMTSPGLQVSPILNMAGRHEFNQLIFDDCFVPDEMVLGQPGQGWSVVTGELAFERSGPDRYLSNFLLLKALIDKVGPSPNDRQAREIGRLVAHVAALRRMSASIAVMSEQGRAPNIESALVKDMGTTFERDIPEVARDILPIEASPDDDDDYASTLADILLDAPSYTIRGGTREIMRGVIARGLGLR